MGKEQKRGFTIVELLVIVTIIGVISSIVLVVITAARNQGLDASIKQNMAQVRTRAELLYNSNPPALGYGQVFSTTTTQIGPGAFTDSVSCGNANGQPVWNIFLDVTVNNFLIATGCSLTGPTNLCRCVAKTDRWAASAPLKSVAGSWCIDSGGLSKVGYIGTDGGCL